MHDHATATRRQFFRTAGRALAGAGGVAVLGAGVRASADDVIAPVDPDTVGTAAAAVEPAERLGLTAPVAFPFADVEPGDLVCLNNFGTCRRNHQGVDIGEARVLETPATLVACADGVVTQRDTSGRPGNFVVLHGDDGRWYRYHHLGEFDEAVEVGGRVERGQRLGTMGASGNTSWPHLHFEVWVGDGAYSPAGVVFDPVPLLAIPATVEVRARVCE